jgi:hypothetical protein
VDEKGITQTFNGIVIVMTGHCRENEEVSRYTDDTLNT